MGDNLMYCAATAKRLPERMIRHAERRCPSSERRSASPVNRISCRASILGLVSPARPSAIRWRVASIIANAIKSHSRRTPTHILIERSERFAPFSADSYTVTAISVIGSLARVCASGYRRPPRLPLPCPMATMDQLRRPGPLSVQTSTTLSPAVDKIVRKSPLDCSALTPTPPASLAGRTPANLQSPERPPTEAS